MPNPVSCVRRIAFFAFCFLAALPGFSQATGAKTTPPPARNSSGLRQPPCWQEVGIAKTAIEQRRTIEQSTRSQVESVCADSTLTPQQKHQKIKELRQEARQQIDAIITPQQQQELKACNAQRAGNRPAAPRPPVAGGLGPCGESASATPDAPEGERPTDAPKQP